MSELAVEALKLSCRFGDRLAVDDVSFSVPKGTLFALLGPNGGGKTTLFRMLATTLLPSAGSFRIAGLNPAANLKDVRQKLGVVFQSPSLDKKLSVEENIRFHGQLYGLKRKEISIRTEQLLTGFQLADRAAERVEKLSGGLARRVEIAKALLPRPEVLLLDEPSTGLDPIARRTLRDLLKRLSLQAGTTILLTTHLFEEADIADRIALIDQGKLVSSGSPSELKDRVGGDVVVVETDGHRNAETLATEISQSETLGIEPSHIRVVGDTVRLEGHDGHTLIPVLVERFPGRFRSITLGRPSLEDVFIAATGHRFEEAETR